MKISETLVTSGIRAVSVALSGSLRVLRVAHFNPLTLSAVPCSGAKVRNTVSKQQFLYYKTV
ncbi:MAG: hypothetical protein P8R37_04680 [Opitutae bacterium]|nr:hypothetical protein [Opitutae bacterium]